MDYSTIYFGKPINDLVYEDIERFFIVEREENETIEFKSFHLNSTFDKDINNIIIGIDAFLNSQGGILIWGAPRGKKVENKKEQIFVGALSPGTVVKEKDSLINIVSSKITPLPIGINVKILEKNAQYLYVFEVQQSSYKPHQFSDKYFVRLDGQSKAAPHYLVEALIKKITFPDINGYIKFEKYYHKERKYYINFSVFLANFSKFQNEENAAFQLLIFPGDIIVNMRSYGGEYYSTDFSVLHNGRPIRSNFDLVIKKDVLDRLDYKVTFSLTFGGKYSPAKSSNYILNLLEALPTSEGKNANNLISEYKENVLFSDYQESIGKSKDTFIQDHIGRQ